MLRNETTAVQRLLVTFLCLSLCPCLLPQQAEAQIGKRVQIQIGKPSVWSMGQAHYLLADMRKKNRDLKTRMPDDTALDPNAINATSIKILRTLLDVRGEYNQKIAVENSQAQREERFDVRRRDEARSRLAGKQNERDDLQFRIEDIDRRLARLQKEKVLRDEEREKDAPLTAEDRARELKIAELESTLASRNAEKTRLDSEITALETTATANVGTTTLTAPSIPSNDAVADLPGLDFLSDYIKNSIGQVKQPSLSASIALDNFIGMQYEIIAKQLTLLRDELGPDERLVFLELPSNIYTVPDKSDDYIVQLRWRAKHYYKSNAARAKQSHSDSQSENRQTEWDRIEESLYGLKASQRSSVCAPDEQEQSGKPKAGPLSKNEGWLCVNPRSSKRNEFVAIRDGVTTEEPNLRRAAVRALDVIPRQSALNVNETYATANKKNFLGVLKLLSGIGLQVNYQRERQLYEQFLQQEIFASGFGKGRDEFGWTFGPQPGSKRVSPGLRTTYAVLAVPRYASALDIEVEGVAYPRKKTPDYKHRPDENSNQLVTHESFVVRIPNEITENFWVDTVDYTPVTSGGTVTVKINGRNFSPQTGVLVNSVPLKRSLSLASNETIDAAITAATGSGVHGAFELLSRDDIMLTFNMGDASFVGTPTITLVTPERTDSINNLPLDRVNGTLKQNEYKPTLREFSSIEPMFTQSLSLREYVKEQSGEVTCNGNTYLKGRLYGAGMLPEALIEVDGRLITQVNRKGIQNYVAREKRELITTYINREKGEKGQITEQKEQEAKRSAEAAFDESGTLEDALTEINPALNYTNKECTDKKTPREYVYQHSTGEYRIFARVRNKNKFEVRYKHQTAHGFDVATYKYVDSQQPQVRRYVAEAGANHSLVDLRITTNLSLDRRSVSLGDGEEKDADKRPDIKFEGDKNYRAVFLVTDEKLGMKGGQAIMAKRDTITVTIADKDDERTKQFFDVALPIEPKITGVVNPGTGKAEGKADEEPVATISGRDLHHVKRVFFGEQEATIVGGPTFDSVEVKVPKRGDVADGEKITVSVRVVTPANKVSSNSHYTFVGKPKAAQTTATPTKTGQGTQ